jgi:hypothetical protein
MRVAAAAGRSDIPEGIVMAAYLVANYRIDDRCAVRSGDMTFGADVRTGAAVATADDCIDTSPDW